MWDLDHKEGWAPKNWCFQIVVLEKTLESPLDSKETKPVNPKENQPWIFIVKDLCWSWSSNYLVTWCEDPTHWKGPSRWERLGAGEEGDWIWDGWMASLIQWTRIKSMDMNLSKPWETEKDRETWHAAVHGIENRWTQLSDWTTTTLKWQEKPYCKEWKGRQETRQVPKQRQVGIES